MSGSRRRYLACLLAGGLLACCGPRQARAAQLPAEVAAGRCDDLDTQSLIQAIETELPALRHIDLAGARFGHARLKPGDYARSTLEPLLDAARHGPKALCAALQRDFVLYRLSGQAASSRGHFSAYFHPVIHGSRSHTERFSIPLYRRPAEPASALTTAEILDGGLAGRSLELCYVDSLLTALTVHIEGSATVQFDDGSELNLTTDGHNGQPYTNPFKLARADGIFSASPPPAASPPAAGPAGTPSTPSTEAAHSFKSKASAYFAEHPDVLHKYWAKNPHFVFFKETPLHGTGKFGQLVPGRSVAIDATKIPLGAALWMRTELATAGPPASYSPIARLALAQDTGAAIRGRGRVDVFVGSGAAARVAAALTSRPGELYLVLNKPSKSSSKNSPKNSPKNSQTHRRKPRE